MPMRRELMNLNSSWLLLLAALVSVLILWLQVYPLFNVIHSFLACTTMST